MKWIALSSISRYCLLLAYCASNSFAADRWNPTSVIADVAISKNGVPLCVPARVDGKSTVFIVDTGAQHTLIDKSLVARSTPTGKVNMKMAASALTVDVYKSPPMEIAGVNCEWITEVPAFDMSDIRRQLSAQVYGVVGMNFLSQYRVHLDFDNGRFVLCDGADSRNVPPGTKIPMMRNLKMSPVVEITFGDTRVSERFEIDTGLYGRSEMTADLARLLQDSKGARGIESNGIDEAGKVVEGLRIGAFAIGPHEHHEYAMFVRRHNVLGLQFLVRYRATFDFPRNCLYLQPGDRLRLKDPPIGLGFDVDSDDIIIRVDKESVAAQAGFKIGDVMTSINGKKPSELSNLEMLRILTFPTREDMIITVRRGSAIITARYPGG